MTVVTVFEKIPEIFVELYDAQFQQWAREFHRRGRFAAIVFHAVPGQKMMRDEAGEPVWKGCWLEANLEPGRGGQTRIVVKPRTDHDREMIERHVRDMAAHFLH